MYAKLTALCMCIHETFCRESIAPFAKITLFALQIGRLSSYTLTYITKHFMLVLRIFNIAIEFAYEVIGNNFLGCVAKINIVD